jgi:hypothetical protein
MLGMATSKEYSALPVAKPAFKRLDQRGEYLACDTEVDQASGWLQHRRRPLFFRRQQYSSL